MTTTPRTPSGTLELLPRDQALHDGMLDVIRRGYQRFGFVPIETPAFERTDVLLTKTGGETERQVYFVQSAGSREQGDEPDLALRFDLTVPLARYVAEHEQELTFPFRRYQIEQVYRGERPQRGRYREFYQCDIDVIDRNELSIRHDAEVAATMVSILDELGIGEFKLRLNNRRFMRGVLSSVGVTAGDMQQDVLREVDKLARRGADAVAGTLVDGGMTDRDASRLLEITSVQASGVEAMVEAVENITLRADEAQPGGAEIVEVVKRMDDLGVPADRYCLDLSIARGLDYYTGTVYETTLDDHPELGSICSGGRYDDLAGQYTSTKLPGVGLSIGFTRLFSQLLQAGLIEAAGSSVQVLVTLLDDGDLRYALEVASQLRRAGVPTESQLEPAKLGRQLKQADRAGIRFAAITGEKERNSRTVTVKDLRRGDQTEVALNDLVAHIQTNR